MDSAPSAAEHEESDVVLEWPRTPRPSDMQNSDWRSVGRRTSRVVARYSITFLIGIGVTLAWQSYRDEAVEIVRAEAPSLVWLLPVSTAKPHPESQGSTAAAESSPQLVQIVRRLEPVELGLIAVRRSVEQLAMNVERLAIKVEQLDAKQDQIAKNIATLRSKEVNQKMSSSPGSQAVPPRKPLQPTALSPATR